jgi:hypothetical protein
MAPFFWREGKGRAAEREVGSTNSRDEYPRTAERSSEAPQDLTKVDLLGPPASSHGTRGAALLQLRSSM